MKNKKKLKEQVDVLQKSIEISNKTKLITSILLFLGYLIICITITSPYVLSYGDSGEMITAAFTKGLAHPPAYPLYTFLGFYITHLPFLSPAHWYNLFSGFLHSLALVFIYLSSIEILRELFKIKKNSDIPFLTKTINFASVIGTLSLGFSFLFFLYSGITEVFPLNDLFISLVIFSTLLFRKYWIAAETKKFTLSLILLCICIGLMLSNQQTSILIIPPILLLLITTYFSYKISNRSKYGIILTITGILVAVICFFLPYSYLFILSNSSAIFSWGHVKNINDLFNEILRKDFAVVPLPTKSAAPVSASALTAYKSGLDWLQSIHYIGFLINHFELSFILGILGVIMPIYNSRKRLKIRTFLKENDLVIFLFLMIFLSGIFLASYTPINFADTGVADFYNDTEIHLRLYLQSEVMFTLYISIGAFYIIQFITFISPQIKKGLNTKRIKLISIIILSIFPLFSLIHNYQGVNNSKTDIYQFEAENSLKSVPKNSIIICYTDAVCFPYAYTHYVLDVRKDVILVSLSVTRYKDKLLKAYPALFKTKNPSDEYTINDIIARNINKRNIFLSFPSSDQLSSAGGQNNPFNVVPYGYLFKVVRDPSNFTLNDFNQSQTFASKIDKDLITINPDLRDFRAMSIRQAYSVIKLFQAYTLFNDGYKNYALTLFKQAQQIPIAELDTIAQVKAYFDNMQPGHIKLSSYNDFITSGIAQLNAGNDTKAEGLFLSAHLLEPDNKEAMNYLLESFKLNDDIVTYQTLKKDPQ